MTETTTWADGFGIWHASVLAAIVATGAGALILTTIPGDTFRDLAPACATEDSPGPCYWNADTQGNGRGQSFYRDERGTIHPR